MSTELHSSLEDGALREFEVTITETLQMTVTVEATDQLDAELIVNDAWDDGDYILDAESFKGVEFEAKLTNNEIIRESEPYEKGGKYDMNVENKATVSTPLAENEYVKQLFDILTDNGKDASGLAALIGHVGEMESFVKSAEDKITDMKSQLETMKEIQNHPIKTTLQNTIKTLETKVADLKEQISNMKISIIEGCKKAVTSFEEKGISALNNLASFFKVKRGLENCKKEIDKVISIDDRAIAKIVTFSDEYHSAGRALSNMARVAFGKEPIDTKKEAGKLAKALAAPYKAEKSVMIKLKGSIDNTILKLNQLESTAANKKAERTNEKPSIIDKLDDNKERVKEAKRDMPVPERTKTQAQEV
jgi:hypothetical protein